MKPTRLTQEQGLKVAKAAAYVGISAVLAFLIGQVTDHPQAFGIYTPIINIVLVTLKQVFSDD